MDIAQIAFGRGDRIQHDKTAEANIVLSGALDVTDDQHVVVAAGVGVGQGKDAGPALLDLP